MQASTSAQLLHCESSKCLKGESDEEIVPGREDDMKLSDVPEDMREAVQGSWKPRQSETFRRLFGHLRQFELETRPGREVRELLGSLWQPRQQKAGSSFGFQMPRPRVRTCREEAPGGAALGRRSPAAAGPLEAELGPGSEAGKH